MKFELGSMKCVGGFSRTRWSRIFPARSTSKVVVLLALTIIFATTACGTTLSLVTRRDNRVYKRWEISGVPRGIAVSRDGFIYVGLAESQSVAKIDPKSGELLDEVVLDSPEIASTKDLATLRIDEVHDRLIIANGSDESVSILSLGKLAVLREITLEGETILDAIPDPAGRYLYILGSRSVHIFDSGGQRRIRRIDKMSPMAMAVSTDGRLLAVVGSEEFSAGTATVVSVWDIETMKELGTEPLQTDQRIESVLFAASNQTLVFFARNLVVEKPVEARKSETMMRHPDGGIYISLDFGDIVSSELICLPDGSGPQIATPGASSDLVYFAESRCGHDGKFTASPRKVRTAPVYGIRAYAMQYHEPTNAIYATDTEGFLTVYRVPKLK